MKKQARKKRHEEQKQLASAQLNNLIGSDDTFYFIAGYTPGGAAYGITWKEMEDLENDFTIMG